MARVKYFRVSLKSESKTYGNNSVAWYIVIWRGPNGTIVPVPIRSKSRARRIARIIYRALSADMARHQAEARERIAAIPREATEED